MTRTTLALVTVMAGEMCAAPVTNHWPSKRPICVQYGCNHAMIERARTVDIDEKRLRACVSMYSRKWNRCDACALLRPSRYVQRRVSLEVWCGAWSRSMICNNQYPLYVLIPSTPPIMAASNHSPFSHLNVAIFTGGHLVTSGAWASTTCLRPAAAVSTCEKG